MSTITNFSSRHHLSLLIHESCCSPADVIPLLEIVRTEKTSLQVIADLLDVGQRIGKTPVVVANKWPWICC